MNSSKNSKVIKVILNRGEESSLEPRMLRSRFHQQVTSKGKLLVDQSPLPLDRNQEEYINSRDMF